MNMSANFFKQATVQTPPVNPGNSSLEGAAAAANAATAAAAASTPPAPLAGFEALWQSDPNKQAVQPTGVLPAVTAEQLSATLANSNFLANIPQDLMTKAAGGDSAAFADVINQGLRGVMLQAVLASHGLVNAGAKAQGEQLMGKLPSMVRSSTVTDSLTSNPLYNNPAIKPVMDSVRNQLETKYPQAGSSEIASMLDSYFADFGKAFTGGGAATDAGNTGGKSAAGETNWFDLLNLPK